MKDIYFTDANNGLAVGMAALILKTTNYGEDWLEIPIATNQTFNSVYFFNNDFGYVAGIGGTIFKTTNAGNSWYLQQTPTENVLNDIFL